MHREGQEQSGDQMGARKLGADSAKQKGGCFLDTGTGQLEGHGG